MIADPNCSVCGAGNWSNLGLHVYRRTDSPREETYLGKRLQVLFDVWFPCSDEVTLSILGCRECGFVCYSPRPSAEDLVKKYAFLGAFDSVSADGVPVDSPYEKKRSRRMEAILRRVTPMPGVRILDYGGKDGRLMRYVAEQGAACYVVDYNPQVCPWVTRLGSTMADLGSRMEAFDVIVLSHVLEHVGAPVDLLTDLRSRLRADGWVYCEVPMECWHHLPRLEEPVTHVNFFTPNSLTTAFRRAGFDRIQCGICEYWSNPPDQLGLAIACWARPGRTMLDGNAVLKSDLPRYLSPSLLTRLRVAVSAPKVARCHIRHHLHRLQEPVA